MYGAVDETGLELGVHSGGGNNANFGDAGQGKGAYTIPTDRRRR
jgi:hypothetical protein